LKEEKIFVLSPTGTEKRAKERVRKPNGYTSGLPGCQTRRGQLVGRIVRRGDKKKK